jgi:hypothetical protein
MSLDALYAQLGFYAEIASILGGFICVYLMQVILRERTPLVWLQKASLGFLAVALFANGWFYYPSWALIDGHRPTGAIVAIALFFNLLVMAIRGHMMYQPGMGHEAGASRSRRAGA